MRAPEYADRFGQQIGFAELHGVEIESLPDLALQFVIIGPRIGGVLYDRYHNYQAAFYTAAALAGVARSNYAGRTRATVAFCAASMV